MQSSKLVAALEAAANGFRVFPVMPNSKAPAIDDWPDKATISAERIDKWWSDNPEYNIGIATGRGVTVIDADCKKGKAGLDSLAMLDMLGLPGSFRATTPSGGVHVYLKTAKAFGNRADTIPDYPGIDLRGERGYVLAPGSTIDGVAYAAIGNPDSIRQAPQWLEEHLDRRTTHAPRDDTPLVDLDRPENMAKAIDWLQNRAPEAVEGAGGDTTTFSVAAELRAFGLSEDAALAALLDHWNEAKASPPWMPDDLAVKVRNAYAHGQGAPGYKTAAGEFSVLDIDVGDPPAATEARTENPASKRTISARPYEFVDPATIPARQWLMGRHLIRKFVSITVAPGNIGKSSLTIAEALAMVSGKNLVGHPVVAPLRVWYWNLEDPYDELQRRIQAACQHYDLSPSDIAGRLFVDSGRDSPLRLAVADSNGAKIVRPVSDGLTSEMIRLGVDVLIVDPFISSHGVSENDNLAIDTVAKEWGRIADRANAAIELVHHTRKAGGGETETTVESARGGKALTDAARDVRVLNRMSKEDGEKAGIDNHRLYFRTYSDKANMAPPADRSDWFKLESVSLANGDEVGVVAPWTWPDPFADVTADHVRKVQIVVAGGEYRESVQSKDWVGYAIGDVVGLNPAVPSEKEKIKQMLREWITKGWLRSRMVRDEKGKDRPTVVVGKPLQEDFCEVPI